MTAVLRSPASLLLLAGCGARSMLDLGATAFGPPDSGEVGTVGADGGGVGPGVGSSQPPSDAGAVVEQDGAAVGPSDAAAVVQPDSTVGPTAACSGGVVKLATTAPFPSEVATDGAYVYWNDQTGLMRVPSAGGAAQQLAAYLPARWPDLSAFALSTVTVYFGRVLTQDVGSVSKGGGPVLSVMGLPALGSPEVAAGGGDIYAWSFGSAPDRLYTISAAGVGSGIALSGLVVEALAIDSGLAYLASGTGVQVIDLTSGGLKTLTSTPALAVATDATDVYFSALPATASSLNLGRVPKGGGTVTPLVKPSGAGTAGIVTTESDVYFADRDLSALRKIVGKDPARIITVATFATVEQPIGVAVDGQCVYVAVQGSNGNSAGAIYAAPL